MLLLLCYIAVVGADELWKCDTLVTRVRQPDDLSPVTFPNGSSLTDPRPIENNMTCIFMVDVKAGFYGKLSLSGALRKDDSLIFQHMNGYTHSFDSNHDTLHAQWLTEGFTEITLQTGGNETGLLKLSAQLSWSAAPQRSIKHIDVTSGEPAVRLQMERLANIAYIVKSTTNVSVVATPVEETEHGFDELDSCFIYEGTNRTTKLDRTLADVFNGQLISSTNQIYIECIDDTVFYDGYLLIQDAANTKNMATYEMRLLDNGLTLPMNATTGYMGVTVMHEGDRTMRVAKIVWTGGDKGTLSVLEGNLPPPTAAISFNRQNSTGIYNTKAEYVTFWLDSGSCNVTLEKGAAPLGLLSVLLILAAFL